MEHAHKGYLVGLVTAQGLERRIERLHGKIREELQDQDISKQDASSGWLKRWHLFLFHQMLASGDLCTRKQCP